MARILGTEGPRPDVVANERGHAECLPPVSARAWHTGCAPGEDLHPTVPGRTSSLPAWPDDMRVTRAAPAGERGRVGGAGGHPARRHEVSSSSSSRAVGPVRRLQPTCPCW